MSLEADPREEGPRWPPLDGEEGPAPRLRPEHAARLVGRAVEAAFTRRTRWQRRMPVFLWAAAAALAMAGAAAAISVATRQRLDNATTAPPARSGSGAPSFPRTGGRAHRTPDLAEAAATPSVAPSSTLDESLSVPSALTTLASRPAADDLLERANQLRRAGEWQRAEATYAQVVHAHPGTAQAYVATLAAAALRLDHLGDPGGALRLYRSVRPAGALAAEAQFGAARCHRALGNRDAEAAALRQLIASRPGSLLLRQAEDRLREIEAGER